MQNKCTRRSVKNVITLKPVDQKLIQVENLMNANSCVELMIQ